MTLNFLPLLFLGVFSQTLESSDVGHHPVVNHLSDDLAAVTTVAGADEVVYDLEVEAIDEHADFSLFLGHLPSLLSPSS